jgi:hypothetical protein
MYSRPRASFTSARSPILDSSLPKLSSSLSYRRALGAATFRLTSLLCSFSHLDPSSELVRSDGAGALSGPVNGGTARDPVPLTVEAPACNGWYVPCEDCDPDLLNLALDMDPVPAVLDLKVIFCTRSSKLKCDRRCEVGLSLPLGS